MQTSSMTETGPYGRMLFLFNDSGVGTGSWEFSTSSIGYAGAFIYITGAAGTTGSLDEQAFAGFGTYGEAGDQFNNPETRGGSGSVTGPIT